MTAESLTIAKQAIAEEFACENADERKSFQAKTLELEYRCKNRSTLCSEVKLSFIRDKEGKPITKTSSISELGLGIPEEHLDKLFDLYFSTKERVTELTFMFRCDLMVMTVRRGDGASEFYEISERLLEKSTLTKEKNIRRLAIPHHGGAVTMEANTNEFGRNTEYPLLGMDGRNGQIPQESTCR